MEIIFDRTQPINRNLNYSVKTNNNANVITFILNDQQESIFLHNLTCYVKVQATSFLDKEHAEYSYEGDLIKVTWVMKRKVTQFKTIQVQLQFEGGDDIVWQTEIFNMTLANTIPADKEIPNKYPSILSQIEDELDNHEGRIDTLEDNVDRLETNKQDKLVSGENIKTINGESILGSGDLIIEPGVTGEIIDITGGLTEEIREKVRENPSSLLRWGEIVYSPTYYAGSDELPTYYTCVADSEKVVYWFYINWEELEIVDEETYPVDTSDCSKRYEVPNDFENLPNNLLKQIKIGDTIYSTSMEGSIQCIVKMPDNITFQYRERLYYYLKENGVWVYDGQYQFVVYKTNTPNIIYANRQDGNQTSISYSVSADNNNIVRRNVEGQIIVKFTPTEANHATSKSMLMIISKMFVRLLKENVNQLLFLIKKLHQQLTHKHKH